MPLQHGADLVDALGSEHLVRQPLADRAGHEQCGRINAANGTTHRSVNGNGTTTGGIIGDNYRLTAINTTQWAVSGTMVNTGTAATMFATS